MKIVSYNVNGIRAAARKGFYEWMLAQNADVVCIQELKAQVDQLTDPIFSPPGYHVAFECAEKKGYSGVAIYSKQKPDKIHRGLGWPVMDTEGRYLQADFGKLSVASIYLPSGSSKDERQVLKMDCLARYYELLKKMKRRKRSYIISGDWNIAHKKIDIKNWRGNQKNSGFLPEERAWVDKIFQGAGYIDSFCELEQADDQYTWWSNRGQAWANNVGWRLDYQMVTPKLASTVLAADIYKEERFSDHAPLTIDYDYEL